MRFACKVVRTTTMPTKTPSSPAAPGTSLQPYTSCDRYALPMHLPFPVVVVPSGPDFWDILTALGTAGAVIVALFLGVRDQRRSAQVQRDELLRLERERDEAQTAQRTAEQRDAQREREAQARTVTIWARRFAIGDQKNMTLGIANGSSQIITSVMVIVEKSDASRYIALSSQVVEAGAYFAGIALDPDLATEWPKSDRVYVEFDDAAGESWRKFENGSLERAVSGDRPSAEGPATAWVEIVHRR